ncbi:DNA polymerase IV [Candidatus Enterovibrio altilux]|uniref:DNA polymerase IV n=2 Tax=Candidatus Enterovibrio altilux TaxID=1927128 RepID=A0A291BBC3_9GAMM|nr:DNA polymerase IV [Candidatus Enterovibrio luxaltus]
MDCFYAAVEMRDNHSLRGIPLAIGGSEKLRGVISTCSYEARKFGVRSAMATSHALKLCPTLKVIHSDIKKYKAVSIQIRAILGRYTDRIEQLSLDEAYLDVSDSSLFYGSATLIAGDIRHTVKRELGLTASTGIAPVKFIAKIASDLNKPDGTFVITPDGVENFVKTLALKRIPGVGKVTIAKLYAMNLYKGEDVQAYDKNALLVQFGKFGQSLWNSCHGIDTREVETNHIKKSIGVERTLPKDIQSEAECLYVMKLLYAEMKVRLKQACPDLLIARQGVKLKFSDFQQTTVEHRQWRYNTDVFPELMHEALSRQKNRRVRLIGITVGLLATNKNKTSQLSFDW